MKRCILTVIVILLLLPGWGMASGIPTFPFVFVTGQAEQEVSPDIATVSFGVQVFDADPGHALSQIEERSAELMAIFAKSGVENKDVVAYEINKEVVRERKDYIALKILGYELTRRMSVTIRKLADFDVLMMQFIGLKNVSQVHTVFDTTKRKEIESDLFRQAAQKARQQADLLAKGFGSEISSVHAISVTPWGFGGIDNEFGLGPTYRGYAAAAPAQAAREKGMNVLVPNTIKLQKAVSAIYKLR
jgi:uncharacterized protein